MAEHAGLRIVREMPFHRRQRRAHKMPAPRQVLRVAVSKVPFEVRTNTRRDQRVAVGHYHLGQSTYTRPLAESAGSSGGAGYASSKYSMMAIR
jgi:hypothetical protein